MSEESLAGNRYFFLLVDNYNKWCWVYMLKNKSEAFENLQRFHVLVERQIRKKLKAIRSNRGGEFSSFCFQKYCENLGIKREFTTPYTPQQNGVVERKNKNVVEMARSLLKSRNLPIKLWGKATATTVYLINRSPTHALYNKTPFEVWHGVKPSVSHLKVFGWTAFALITSYKPHKLDEKSEKCVFVGYSS